MVDLRNVPAGTYVRLRDGRVKRVICHNGDSTTQIEDIGCVWSDSGERARGLERKEDVVEIITADPIFPDSRGWVHVGDAAVKWFGDQFVQVFASGEIWYNKWDSAEWFAAIEDCDTQQQSIDAIEAAWAKHIAATTETDADKAARLEAENAELRRRLELIGDAVRVRSADGAD